ncbi:MAG: hypothetical protein ACFE9N_12590 [Promethearchaeota archaeon]
MVEKLGIILRNVKAPEVSSNELKSILTSLGTKSIDTIVCDNILEAKEIIQEKFEIISFIFFTSPIPKIDKTTQSFIEFITNNEDYKHIEFFARMHKEEQKKKYKWYDDFINYIKL